MENKKGERMKIHCGNCDYDKALKGKKTKMKYDVSGLDYVTLDSVTVYTCPHCAEKFYDFGNVEKLNATIAEYIATQEEPLSGKEIRFIRKFLGYDTTMFAKEMLKIKTETLSRMENEKQECSETLDQFIKVLALTKRPDRNYDLHEKIKAKKHPAPERILVKTKGENFLVQAFA